MGIVSGLDVGLGSRVAGNDEGRAMPCGIGRLQ
jgi:hypothetical protein